MKASAQMSGYNAWSMLEKQHLETPQNTWANSNGVIKYGTDGHHREKNFMRNKTKNEIAAIQLQEPPLQISDEGCLRCNMRTDILLLWPWKRKRGGSFISQISSFHPLGWCLKMADIFCILIKDLWNSNCKECALHIISPGGKPSFPPFLFSSFPPYLFISFPPLFLSFFPPFLLSLPSFLFSFSFFLKITKPVIL